VIPPNDEVVRAIVAPDESMPERLTWSRHAHCQWQECEHDLVGSIMVVGQRFVGADPRVMIDITWLGHTDNRMQQQGAIGFLGRAFG